MKTDAPIDRLMEENERLKALNRALFKQHTEATDLLRAIVADVEAMHVGDDHFGFFEENYTNDDGNVEIAWPNLSLLIVKAQLLLQQQKRGKL